MYTYYEYIAVLRQMLVMTMLLFVSTIAGTDECAFKKTLRKAKKKCNVDCSIFFSEGRTSVCDMIPIFLEASFLTHHRHHRDTVFIQHFSLLFYCSLVTFSLQVPMCTLLLLYFLLELDESKLSNKIFPYLSLIHKFIASATQHIWKHTHV